LDKTKQGKTIAQWEITAKINKNKRSQAGLPDSIFAYKNSNLDTFLKALECKFLVYFMAIRNVVRQNGIILRQIGIFCGHFGEIHVLVCCTKINLATLTPEAHS
jgi:hypothetical protein